VQKAVTWQAHSFKEFLGINDLYLKSQQLLFEQDVFAVSAYQ
jgi:hypothetical protein